MLKPSPKILLLLFLCFLGGKGFSQDTTKVAIPAIWDLAACLEYAKSNNITLKNLRLDQKSAEQDKLLAKSALLPDLYGTGNITYNHYNSAGTSIVTGAGTTVVTSPSINNSGSLGLSSSWTLYQGGYLKTDIKQKDLSIQSANYNVLVSENDITLQITQAYLGILVDKESIIYNRDLVKTSTAQLAQAQRRFDAGSVAKKEVIQFQAQLATDQYNLTAAENAERTDKITLKQLLQLPETQNFEVLRPDTISPVGVIPDLSSVQQYALTNRPEIKGAELAVKIADLDLSKAKSGYLPTLSMGASTGTSFTNGNTFSTFKQFDNNFYQQAGLTLSVPIFTKRANKTAVAKARISVLQNRNLLENAKTTLTLTTEQAYITVQNSKTQFNSAEEQLKYNKELYRISNEELRIGTVNIYDFYQQRNLYVQALQTFIQAKYNAALAARIYEFYLGIPIKL
jgi:outer membrane protein